MNKVNILTHIVFGIFFISKVTAQEWVVPEDKKSKESPFKFTGETSSKGQVIFQQNCTVCHGEPGKGTYNKGLVPVPGDPATDKFQKQVDGSLFFKITNGRGAMPQFKDILTEEQRWQVISYFRSFNKNYIQPTGGNNAVASEVQHVFLSMSFITASGQVKASVTDTLKKPIKGAEIVLFVKRYFGNMKIGESALTNEKGEAVFDFPKDLPGDKKGNVVLIGKLNVAGSDVQKIDTLAIGIPTDKPPLTSKRAMWNVMSKAPLWLLLSYFIVVFVIWGFLIYIVFQLVKIRNDNKRLSTNKQ